jgi:hypothetical protein
MTATERWTCPTCKTAVSTPFCPTCGERPLNPRELTLHGLVSQIFEALTNIDGRLIRTVRYLFGRPGGLTAAYLQGQRKPYIGPVPLFFIANVLFFAIESWTGGKVFTTPLESHLHTQPWSDFTPQLVSRRLDALQTTQAQYAPVFDQAVALNARSFIILMALAFAIVPALVFFRRGCPLVAHAVFSLHLYTFLLLLLCVATAIPPIDAWFGGGGFASEPLDHAIFFSLLGGCAIYLYFATGKVYATRGVLRVLQTLALTVGVAIIVLGYRFALLLITLYST